MDFILDIWPLILMLFGLGCVAGFLAGLLGVGGGIVLVPGLYFVFTQSHDVIPFDIAQIMHICVATSLAIIVPTGLSSTVAHYKRGSVDFAIVFRLGLGVLFGVALATWGVKYIPVDGMRVIFASSIFILSLVMMRGAMKKTGQEKEVKERKLLPHRFYPAVGIGIGGLSTLIGIGGATLSVPFMSGQKVAMHRAVGTASALGVVIALPASVGFMISGYGTGDMPPLSIGYVNALAWLCVIPTSILIAPFGASCAHKLPVRKLKFAFAIFVLLLAINMWRGILTGT